MLKILGHELSTASPDSTRQYQRIVNGKLVALSQMKRTIMAIER